MSLSVSLTTLLLTSLRTVPAYVAFFALFSLLSFPKLPVVNPFPPAAARKIYSHNKKKSQKLSAPTQAPNNIPSGICSSKFESYFSKFVFHTLPGLLHILVHTL
jgi:hypothetical protein